MPPIRLDKGVRIVIPAYNAGQSLGPLLLEIERHVPARQIIVVDDGSSDHTAAAAQAKHCELVRHSRNQGKGAAIQSGLRVAFADHRVCACVLMDADGQHEAQFIPRFLAAIEAQQGDLIIGRRTLNPRVMPWPRVLSNRMSSALLRVKLRMPVFDSQCGYRAITRRAFEGIALESAGFDAETEILIKVARAGFSIAWLPISTVYNRESSHIRGFRDTWRFIKAWARF